jgi:putative Mg2+ transporter-C (MgtC) family protein
MSDYVPILTRLLASIAAGFILGLERQYHRQPAGLKTHILICTGSTLLMLVSLFLAGGIGVFSGADKMIADPGRLAAQVVSGIGFLGGGAIIRQGFNIKGLTTAATIWVAAAIGLALGMGAYFAAGVTLALILVMLIVMERVEAHFFPNKNIKTLYLVFEEKYFNYDVLVHELRELKIAVVNMDVARTISSERIKLSLQVHVPQKIDIEGLTETLKRIGTLVRLELTTNEKPTR